MNGHTTRVLHSRGPTYKTAAPLQVYNIESRPQEPVGGAARFMGAAREFAGEQPLVLFSGDCLNPSLMSAFTRGEQVGAGACLLAAE